MAEFDAVLDKDFKSYLDALETASPVEVRGRVTEVTGLVVKAVVPGVSVGELCHIKVHHRNKPVRAEVVGFKDEHVYLMPLGSLEGIGPGSEVVPSGNTLTVRVGPRLLG
ncbi:MAG TPA: EscN/YscN/HrcN family type III secretion system ATPase, partial [Acidobacteriota bacterium]